MRGRLTAALVLLLAAPALLMAAPAVAEPVPAPGYRLTAVASPVLIPSGLAVDGGALLTSDLATGRVIRLGEDGRVRDLAAPLPTGKDVMGEATGPYKVRLREGRVYVSQGWPDVDREAGPLDHAILELDAEGGAPRVLSDDFWNPYDFEWAGDGWLVADAGRNALVRLPAAGGAVEPVFVFPRLEHKEKALATLSPTEFKSDEVYRVDAVPTGVAVGGGRVYVALFGGFPYVARGGVVVSLPAEGTAAGARREVADLDSPIDLAFAADGRLLVLEMGVFDLERGFLPGSGKLTAVDLASGASEVLASGLGLPVTVAPLPGGGALVAQMAGGILRVTRRQ